MSAGTNGGVNGAAGGGANGAAGGDPQAAHDPIPGMASAPGGEPAPRRVDLDRWRGVAAEHADDRTAADIGAFLRGRSRRLLVSLLRPHRKALLRTALMAITFNICSLAGPVLVQQGIDRGIPSLMEGGPGAWVPLAVIVGIFCVTSVAQGLTDYAWITSTGRISQAVLYDLRTRLYRQFQRLSLSFHEQYTSGRVISRLTSDVDALQELLSYGLKGLIWAVLSLSTIAVVLLTYDLPLALAGLSSLIPMAVGTAWFRRESSKAYREQRTAVALVIVHFVESLGGIRAVQAFRREPRNQAIFEGVNGRYRDALTRSSRLQAAYGPGMRTIGNIATAGVLLYGGHRVLGGSIEVGVLAMFLLYLRRFFDPIQELSQFYNVFQGAAAALEKLSGVLEEQPAVPEPSDDEAVALPEPRGDIRFDGVRFAYVEGRTVLHHLDLHIPAGQTVALVGETGAGKSTVARLIARFYDPTEGAVLLDGIDLRRLRTEDLRRAVVMVTQEGYLFTGTVHDNIAFGRPGASRAEVEEAARAIGAHEAFAALPEGYDTDVRARGGRLSSGQRQFVAFARAFLADPQVLILDEATSSLDIPSERMVQQALRTLLADRTAVIIAHRLTTVEIADRVLVVDDGRVVEDGSPEELVARSSRYGDLHRAWLESLT